MNHAMLKHVHLTTVAITYGLFVLRGVWMIRESPRLRDRWVRIVPHVNDTLLLASALVLAWQIGQYPLVDGWLTAKLLGLLAYIGLGLVALRLGRTRSIRIGAWLLAQLVLVYIVAVAITRHAIPIAV